MKKDAIAKFISLAATKTDLERLHFQRLRHRQQQKLQKADDLTHQAKAAMTGSAARKDLSSSVAAEKFRSQLVLKAKREIISAEQMTPQLSGQKQRLAQSLRYEQAWRALHTKAVEAARKKSNEHEERRQEALHLNKIS